MRRVSLWVREGERETRRGARKCQTMAPPGRCATPSAVGDVGGRPTTSPPKPWVTDASVILSSPRHWHSPRERRTTRQGPIRVGCWLARGRSKLLQRGPRDYKTSAVGPRNHCVGALIGETGDNLWSPTPAPYPFASVWGPPTPVTTNGITHRPGRHHL